MVLGKQGSWSCLISGLNKVCKYVEIGLQLTLSIILSNEILDSKSYLSELYDSALAKLCSSSEDGSFWALHFLEKSPSSS